MDRESKGDNIEDLYVETSQRKSDQVHEVFKAHLKNLLEIPEHDPRTNVKITVSSALSAGLLATVLFVLR